jgi:hypothetical protein
MSITFKLLPNDKVPSTVATHQSLSKVSKEKTKGSLRPLDKPGKGWAYAKSLPSSWEEVIIAFLLFLANLLLHSTSSAAFLRAGGGGALKVMKCVIIVVAR